MEEHPGMMVPHGRPHIHTGSSVPHPVHHPIALRLQLQLRVAVTNLGGELVTAGVAKIDM